jgi:hypothetical protein
VGGYAREGSEPESLLCGRIFAVSLELRKDDELALWVDEDQVRKSWL